MKMGRRYTTISPALRSVSLTAVDVDRVPVNVASIRPLISHIAADVESLQRDSMFASTNDSTLVSRIRFRTVQYAGERNCRDCCDQGLDEQKRAYLISLCRDVSPLGTGERFRRSLDWGRH